MLFENMNKMCINHFTTFFYKFDDGIFKIIENILD